MQTFLPYAHIPRAVHVLDTKRLGKQRVETLQILNALREPNYGWKNHPAVRMWIGYEYLLTVYGKMCCNEWVRRGYQDTCWGKIDKIQIEILRAGTKDGKPHGTDPWWLGDERFHISHQSNLLRKDPVFYKDAFPGVPSDLPYFWPTKELPLAA